jgi:hypothetical protein
VTPYLARVARAGDAASVHTRLRLRARSRFEPSGGAPSPIAGVPGDPDAASAVSPGGPRSDRRVRRPSLHARAGLDRGTQQAGGALALRDRRASTAVAEGAPGTTAATDGPSAAGERSAVANPPAVGESRAARESGPAVEQAGATHEGGSTPAVAQRAASPAPQTRRYAQAPPPVPASQPRTTKGSRRRAPRSAVVARVEDLSDDALKNPADLSEATRRAAGPRPGALDSDVRRPEDPLAPYPPPSPQSRVRRAGDRLDVAEPASPTEAVQPANLPLVAAPSPALALPTRVAESRLEQPLITVTIDRVEVRARSKPPALALQPPPRRGATSLSTYLAARARGLTG